KFTINYSGATNITDKYSSVLAIKQVQIGEIINVYYNSEDKIARKIEISEDAWEYTQVENLTYDRTEKIMYIAGEKYKYGESLTVISNGEEKDLLDLNPIDIVTVKGINKKICSVIVTKGHGYIILENEDSFIGGWIDVGQESAKPITEDMLVVASEGNHKVTIAKDGVGGTKSIAVKRFEQTVVDVGDLKSETQKSGSLKFTITPNTASLYVDGAKTDYSELVVVDYGAHRIIVKAEGYSDISQTIVVGSSYAEIEINAEDASSSSTSDSTKDASSDSTTTNSTKSSGTTNSSTNGTSTGGLGSGINLPEINKTGDTNSTGTSTGSSSLTDTDKTTDSTSLSNVLTDALNKALSD
ncbi:hypothetical protein, partial [Lachnotalea glycerini]